MKKLLDEYANSNDLVDFDTSSARIEASRLNAQKSTGPVTAEAKAASSQNRASRRLSQLAGYKVLVSEDQSQYYALVREFFLQFNVNIAAPAVAHSLQAARLSNARYRSEWIWGKNPGIDYSRIGPVIFGWFIVSQDRSPRQCPARQPPQRMRRASVRVKD